MANYLPHTESEVAEMLAFLGMETLDDLFAHIPTSLRIAGGLNLAPGRSEPDVADQISHYASRNKSTADLLCFAGGGAYDHEVPAVVRALASRSEFVTAYTPYQPEVAQGVLQAIFEYQTMIARLAGLPIANASLYDGATALVEAVNMAAAATKRSKLVISAGVHPHWRQVVRTFARGTGHDLVIAPLRDGVTDWSAVDCTEAAAVVASYPNYLGVVENIAAAKDVATSVGALFVVGMDPVMAGVLKSPGSWGADIVVGEGQPFGTALSFGGPYLGLFACTEEQIRRLPGRLVGETVDVEGRRAFVTTLRAREQDIRREKATSNVCTNQTLMAVGAAIQLGWLGTAGLREIAERCVAGAHYAAESLCALDGVTLAVDASFAREFALRLPINASVAIDALGHEGILAGLSVAELASGEEAGVESPETVLLVSVTERRTRSEIDAFVSALGKLVN
jgi:glycine dehydrogenase subunit 1